MLLRVITAIAFLALLCQPALAKSLYVDAQNGDDAVTYAQNSLDQPWRTIGRAAWGSTNRASPNASEAAQPGDEVRVAAGIYWETGDPNGGRFTVSLNPANSGTALNPITFRGEGLVYIRLQAGYRGGMIGCNSRDHIIWDNFQIDDYYGGSTSDTGPVVFSGNARYCQIVNSDIMGHPGSYYHGYPTFGGNYRGISLEPAHHITIRGNRIHRFTGGQNEAGVMAYDSNDNIIENNEFHNNGTAVFIKGVHAGRTQARNVIRRNLVHNNYAGIRVLGSQDAQVYQNIVMNSSFVALWAGHFDSTRTKFVNNTLVNNDLAFVPQGTSLIGVVFHGNIVSSNSEAVHNWNTSGPSEQDVRYDRNLYFGNRIHANFPAAGNNISFSRWQSEYGQDLNGTLADPQFVDAAGNDFRLGVGSPARVVSMDILNLTGTGDTTKIIPAGAYITGGEIIGLPSGDRPSSEPNPPDEVSVR